MGGNRAGFAFEEVVDLVGVEVLVVPFSLRVGWSLDHSKFGKERARLRTSEGEGWIEVTIRGRSE